MADGMPGGGKESRREDESWVEMRYVWKFLQREYTWWAERECREMSLGD